MVYNELEPGDILSEVRVGLAPIAYTDILLRSIWAIFKIRQSPVTTTKIETSQVTPCAYPLIGTNPFRLKLSGSC